MSCGRLWVCILAVCGFLCSVTSDTPFNFTYSMAQRCKEHVSTDGYLYSPFYRLSPLPNADNFTLLDMHIAVLAPRDGHVLLSTREDPDADEPVYEIVLGAGANRFSEIRRLKKRDTKISQRTRDILSAVHFRAFWIRITDDGAVNVGREGEVLPFLHYEDSNPLPIKFFSFATWTGVEAKFLYDCPSPAEYNNTAGRSSQSEMTSPHLTSSQRLLSRLLSSRSTLSPPNSTVAVTLRVSVAAVTYDSATSILHTLLSVSMTWNDAAMKWNPEEYNGTTTLRVGQGQVWKPELYVHNSIDVGELSAIGSEPVYIRQEGALSLHMRSDLSTLCEHVGAPGTLRCLLVIAPWEQHEQIQLLVQKEGVGVDTGLTEATTVSNSWRLEDTSYILSSMELSPYSNITCALSGADQDRERLLLLQLHLTLQRTDRQALIAPLVVSMASTVLWLSPARPTGDRLRLCLPAALCVLLSAITLTIQDMPSNIVLLYEIVLVSCAASLASALLTRALTEERASRLARVACRTPRETYSRFTALDIDSGRLETETQDLRPVREKILFVADCLFSGTYCVFYAVLLSQY